MTRLIAVCALIGIAASALAGEAAKPKTLEEKISYCLGLNIGRSMKEQEVELDLDLLMRGMRDALEGTESAMTEDEVRETMLAFQKQMKSRAAGRAKALGEKNKQEGEAFLAANGKKEGVQTTASGLQYKVIQAGTGAVPKATDTVSVHYRGTLLDGTEFDSSHKRGRPAEFPVNGVIKGWTEALQLMKVGAKWMVYIPSDLAYRDRGAGRLIGPNATLIFEVELLAIK